MIYENHDNISSFVRISEVEMKPLTQTILLSLCLFFLTGCAGQTNPSNLTWTSTPMVQNVSNPNFEASFEPIKLGNNYFAAFQLTITNKTDKDLHINWNRTLYLYKNKTYGVFVFGGITPSDVKNATIPDDIVPPGGRLLKEVMPYKLVAWMPIEKGAPGDQSIKPGILPAGENGILLRVEKSKKPVTEKLSVKIIGEK